jgi:hypothetical protein
MSGCVVGDEALRWISGRAVQDKIRLEKQLLATNFMKLLKC